MRQRAPVALLGMAMAASACLLFSLVSQLTFVGDGWELLAGRPDWSPGTFLQPFNEHPIVLPALTYKLLLTMFGMKSALPFYFVSISLFLTCAFLLFVYVRRRVGGWGALAAALLVLFLGAAYEDLLWEFQMGFFGSTAAGLGALLALDREDRMGDRAATVLLLVSTAYSSLGIPFILAAAARVALDRSAWLRRAYVPLCPLAAYLLWWLFSGKSAGSHVAISDLPEFPRYVFDAVAASVASLLGRQPIDPSGEPPLLARALVVLLAASLIYWLGRRRNVPAGLVVALVLALSFWVLLGLDRGPQRFSSRFQYPSVVFLLLIAAEALRGRRISRPLVFGLATITAGAVVGGISLLQNGYSTVWKPTADQIRSTLAVLDLAGPTAQPSYRVSLPPSIFLPVKKIRAAERKHGSVAFSERQLLAAAEGKRKIADNTMAAAVGLRLRNGSPPKTFLRCSQLHAEAGLDAEGQPFPPARYWLENRGDAAITVRMGRFSDVTPAQVGLIQPRGHKFIVIPKDRSPRPWRMSTRTGALRICVAS